MARPKKSRVVTRAMARYGRVGKPGVAPGRGSPDATGQVPFVPTAQQRRIVENLVSCDIAYEGIAAYLRIPERTLRRHFAEELKNGKNVVFSEVAGGIADDARKGDKTMRIYYSKTRMGWRERQSVGFEDSAGNIVDPNKLFNVNITG